MAQENDRDLTQNNSPSLPTSTEAEAPVSLRDTIERAYDGDDSPAEAPSGQDGRQRDNYGRFVAKDRDEPGVAEPRVPSPERKISEATQTEPEPAAQASSTQAPEHWSADLKSAFNKWTPDVQGEFLNRHREMEADYTRKSQAMSGAVSFTQSVAPVFNDPVVAGTLRQFGVDPATAIQQFGMDIRQAASPNVQDKINLMVDLAQRMGLDPARLFATGSPQPPPNLSKEDWNDPAVRYFAEHLGKTSGELQSLRNDLQQMRQAEAQQRESQLQAETEWTIDQFADEKDSSGRPLRPYFDAVMDEILALYQANPQMELQKIYEKACRANDEVWQHILAQSRQQQQNQNSVERARAAQRSNTRGMTSPVAKPNAKTGNGSLRDTLERSAEEVGF